MKAENFELIQKEREYNVIKSQIMDLEHRLRLVQEEKDRMEADSREIDDLRFRKSETAKDDLRRSNAALVDIEAEVRDQSGKLNAHKSLIEDRNEEIIRLKRVLAGLADEGDRLRREKGALELELRNAHDGHKSAEMEISGFVERSEELKKAKAMEEQRMYDAEGEINQLKRRLQDLQVMADMAEDEHHQKSKQKEEASQIQRYAQGELSSLMGKNRQLQDDHDMLIKKMNDLEAELRLSNRNLDGISLMVEDKEKELTAVRSNSLLVDSKALGAQQELRKCNQDNDTLRTLLDKYKDDAEFQKRLRDQESTEKYRLEEEKQRLSKEAILRDIEARTAKKELEKYQDTHGQLIEERVMTSQELQALKEHTHLLESQNDNVTI